MRGTVDFFLGGALGAVLVGCLAAGGRLIGDPKFRDALGLAFGIEFLGGLAICFLGTILFAGVSGLSRQIRLFLEDRSWLPMTLGISFVVIVRMALMPWTDP